jgi:hypothetical protein
MPGHPGQFLSEFLDLWNEQDLPSSSGGISQENRGELAELVRDAAKPEHPSQRTSAKVLMALSLKGMCLFLSEDGELGLCHQDARPGDLVVALCGHSRLVVLRSLGGARREPGYQLVGNCKLDGAAYREAMGDSGREGTAKAEFFCLE